MLENGDNLNFIGALCLHQNRRDSAIGLIHTTKAQKGLLWYYNIKLQKIFSDVYYDGVLQSLKEQLEKSESSEEIEFLLSKISEVETLING